MGVNKLYLDLTFEHVQFICLLVDFIAAKEKITWDIAYKVLISNEGIFNSLVEDWEFFHTQSLEAVKGYLDIQLKRKGLKWH